MCGLCGAGGELCRYEARMASSAYQKEGTVIDYKSNSYNPSEWYD